MTVVIDSQKAGCSCVLPAARGRPMPIYIPNSEFPNIGAVLSIPTVVFRNATDRRHQIPPTDRHNFAIWNVNCLRKFKNVTFGMDTVYLHSKTCVHAFRSRSAGWRRRPEGPVGDAAVPIGGSHDGAVIWKFVK